MIERIKEELAKRNFFNKDQHGFTTNKSTQTATNQLVNEMKKLNNKVK